MTTLKPPSSELRQSGAPSVQRRQPAHVAIVMLGLIACLSGIWTSGREGLSTLLSSYALTMTQIEAADKAVQLSPSSPEAHYARASLLSAREQWAEAVAAYEQAAALRPHDYVLALELGRARDQANDTEGALAAFREAARLAPFYAKPHWLLGNTLLRSGGRDEALAELRSAATSDSRLLPAAINFAWAIFNGDAQAVERALQPQTVAARMALASFFAKHARASEAIIQFRAAGVLSNEQRRALLADLLTSKSFAEAFEVWASGRQSNGVGSPQGFATFANGGFEEPIPLDDPGFGWQLANNLQSVRAALDPEEPHVGTYSLRLDWSGESNPSTPIISQLVLVGPKARYRLKFAVRTREMLTIGFPVVQVTDASRDGESLLMQSETFPRGTSAWQDYAIEFVTTEATKAVLIVIRRQNCTVAPCAALGHAWVDDFSLEKL